MKTSTYLYGIKKDWGSMTYDDAIRRKIFLANVELAKELDVHHSKRNTTKVNDLTDAIKFNETLLNE